MFHRHALATFVSSTFEHESASARFHSGSESMCLCATTIVRLICPLWHSCAPLENFKFSIDTTQKAAGFTVSITATPGPKTH